MIESTVISISHLKKFMAKKKKKAKKAKKHHKKHR